MHPKSILYLLGSLAPVVLAKAQAPPAPVLLTTAESGVLPVLPTATPFVGVETLEGAIIYDGPMNPGFTGMFTVYEYSELSSFSGIRM